MSRIPVCENPITLLNPNYPQLIASSVKLCVDGMFEPVSEQQRYQVLTGSPLYKVFRLPFVHSLSQDRLDKLNDRDKKIAKNRFYDFLDNSYFVDKDGVCNPIWIQVPCGKCNACRQRKLYNYMLKSLFAAEESQCPVYFVSLTYNNDHLPDAGVSINHIQNFKKRVKRCCDIYFNGRGKNVKFIIASEYGARTGRPHYHCLVYGLPNFSAFGSETFLLVNKFFQYAWRSPQRKSNGRFVSFHEYRKEYPLIFKQRKGYDPLSFGFVNVKEVSSDAPISYITKYILKQDYVDSFVPPTQQKLFLSQSINLGVQWLKQFSHQIKEDGKLKFFSFSSHKFKEVRLSGYYIKKLFPGFTDLVPVELRQNFIKFQTLYHHLTDNFLLSKEHQLALLCNKIYLENRFPFLVFLGLHVDHYDASHSYFKTLADQALKAARLDVSVDDVTSIQDDFTRKVISDTLTECILCFEKCISYNIDYNDLRQKLLDRDTFFKNVDQIDMDYDDYIDLIYQRSTRFSKDNKALKAQQVLF